MIKPKEARNKVLLITINEKAGYLVMGIRLLQVNVSFLIY